MLKNPKVLIINPLGRCASELPSLNIHLLEAYLNKKGLNARSYDLSARLWNNLNTDKEFFKQIYDQFYKKVRTRNGNYLRKILFLFYLNKKFTHIINNFEKKEAVNNELLYFYYLFTRIPLVFYKGSNDPLSSIVLKKLLPSGMLKDSNLFQDFISPPLDTIGKELKKRLTGVNVVCISATYDQQLGPMFSLARFIKEYKPKTRIVIGGRAVTQHANHNKINHQHFKWIDYVITDEGEEPLFKLITSMDNKKRLKDVPNLYYISNDCIVKNRPAFVKNLDSLPPPDYSSFFSDRNIFNKPELLPYEIGRGCYWKKCSFCQTYRTESQYREKSAKKVVKELISLKKSTGVNKFYLITEMLPPKSALKLSKEIVKQRQEIQWETYMRFEKTIDEEFIRIIKKGGCYRLSFGLESGCQKINDTLEKGINLEDAERIISLCKKEKIKINLNVILGVPNESPFQTLKTLKFIYRNKESINVVGFHKFWLYNSSKMYLNPRKYGISRIEDIQTNRFKFERYNFYARHFVGPITRISSFYFNYYRNLKKEAEANN